MDHLIIKLIIETLAAFLFGTVCFDIVHYLFHSALKSKHSLIRKLGSFHTAHHRFFSVSLKVDEQIVKDNFFHQVLVEYIIQLMGIFFCLLFLNPAPVFIAAVLDTLLFLWISYCRGMDYHHQNFSTLPAHKGGLGVDASYHALHHFFPQNYFGSYIKIFDYIAGTGNQIRGKRIAMTGASGALGSNMKRLLEKEGAIITCFKYGLDYTYDDYEKLKPILKETDILFLCHGTKYENTQQANCDSYIKIIELYKSTRPVSVIPAEVWAVGSEIECHPCFGIKKLYGYANSKRNYAKKARNYFRANDIQYRHIVHSAFMSGMGPGLMTANFAAKYTLFYLKRGFKYVPVTYTGIALMNYFRFVFNV